MMQFPYPRKTSDPTSPFSASPYMPARTSPYSRNRTWKTIAPYILGGVTLFWFAVWFFGSGSTVTSSSKFISRPAGSPGAVIVTVFDKDTKKSFRESIIQNREDYAKRHGYTTFYPNSSDYDVMTKVPLSWSKLPALRHAMALNPTAPWLFYLAPNALIMNHNESLQTKVIERRKLESLMIADKPIVPPDSVIKTFSNVAGDRINFIISQDREGLGIGSMLIRTGDWAKYFLDAWYDPLYRSYNFQHAERHALEHVVQWHGTVLAKLALVPQRLFTSYAVSEGSDRKPPGEMYQEGDFVALFHGCHEDLGRDCETEMEGFIKKSKQDRVQKR